MENAENTRNAQNANITPRRAVYHGRKEKFMKYKVLFDKWVYVEADDENDALDKAADGDTVYEEEEPIKAIEVDDFCAEW
jgi:hypothetical protein